jgi:hypothetical protein
MAAENPVQKPEGSDSTEDQTNKKGDESTPTAPPASPPPNGPVATECHGDAYQEKSYRLANKQYWVATTTLIALFIYTGIAGYQAYQMRIATEASKISADAAARAAKITDESFKLTKARIEESDEAICNIRGDLVLQGNIEHLSISNTGKVYARDIQAHIEFTRNSLPSNKKLSLLYQLDVVQDELRGLEPIRKDIVLPDFGKHDWENILATIETVEVSGTLRYENGFGTIKLRSFCQAYVATPNPGPSNPAHLVDCDGLPQFLNDIKAQQERKNPN